MYGIFTYIYHKNQPNVGKYFSPMDHMGSGKLLWYSMAMFPEGEARDPLQSPLHQESQVPKKEGFLHLHFRLCWGWGKLPYISRIHNKAYIGGDSSILGT